MAPGDIGLLTTAGDPAVSPDGAAVACAVTSVDLEANTYRSAVWVARGKEPAVEVTAGEFRDCRPQWSPDGRTLAFVSHRVAGGDPDRKGSELYVLAVEGPGEARCVARSPEEIEEVQWSPDGRRLAFTARVRDEARYGPARDRDRPPVRLTRLFSRFDNVGWVVDRPRQLLVVDATGDGEPIALTGGPWQVTGVTWSPDSARLAFASARHETWDLDRAVDLWSIEARPGAEPEQLTETRLSYSLPAWSPAGDRLAFAVADPAIAPSHPQIGVIDLDSGKTATWTDALDRSCAPFGASRAPVWAGEDLLFTVEDGGAIHLYAAGESGRPRLLVAGAIQIKGFDARGGTLAYCAATATEPSELYVGPLDEIGAASRRTHSGARLAAVCAPIEPERFVVPSTGGAEVEAWVMRPAGCAEGVRYPALLNIHGGPFTQYGYTLFDEFQIQAGAGYAVIFCNPRGSSGYSQSWGRAIRWPGAATDPGTGWGGVDYDDLIAVTDAAVARFPFIDPDRIGVLGGSYGGYMTSWIVSHTDRFAAACSERAVNNLLTEESTSDISGVFVDYVGARHVDDPEAYLRQSPITYAAAITTPLLILHSEGDLRCPISQAEELFVALRLLEREVEFVRFPAEGHELSRSGAPRHRVQRAEVVLEWFDRHLRSQDR
jgi:dipeptidyl aminopeptidase/acylaminoacyl peptidase